MMTSARPSALLGGIRDGPVPAALSLPPPFSCCQASNRVVVQCDARRQKCSAQDPASERVMISSPVASGVPGSRRLSSSVFESGGATSSPTGGSVRGGKPFASAGPIASSSGMGMASPDNIDSLTFDELFGSTTDWRNIQDVVRHALRKLFEVVQSVNQRLREADRTFTTADRSLRSYFDQITEALEEKHAALAKSVSASSSTQKEELERIQSVVLDKQRRDAQAQEARLKMLEQRLEQAVSQMDVLHSENTNLRRELQRMKSEKDREAPALEALRQHVDQIANERPTAALVERAVHQQLVSYDEDKKASTDTLLKVVSKLRKEVERLHETKADAADVAILLSDKSETSQAVRDAFENLVQGTAAASALKRSSATESASDTPSSVEEAAGSLSLSTLSGLSSTVRKLRREVALKADMKDVAVLLDSKADLADINASMGKIAAGLEQRVHVNEFQHTLRQQAAINEALCSQLSLGRWLWTTRKLKAGHGVPWNLQTANTDPDNFRWEADKVNLLVVCPGLYEITFGFFTRKKPTVQLHVNGEPVMSAVNSSSYVLHHSSGRITDASSVPALVAGMGGGGSSGASHVIADSGTATGLTLIDFLSLPANAKIALSFAGEPEHAQGFLSLRKL